MPEAILEVSDIRAGYGKIEVLHGVSIRAREEQTTCIIGPNGCGKSTLFNVICGVIKSTSGNVTFCGEDITRLSSDAILSRGISVSPQGRRVFPFMSVDENLEMGGYTTKNREELDRRKDEIYSQFYRLRERKNQLAGSLSGGEQVLLCLARSLIMRPRIVLLDEPSLGLAPNVREEVFQSILDMKKSLLIIEQNVRKAINISDYVYVLDLGKNKFEGTPKQILENQDLVKLYMGKLA
jgi:branched-chain amino acid transport system ATP-binding protein